MLMPYQEEPEGAKLRQNIDEDELAFWKDRLSAIPDLRWAKVMRLRRAIHTNGYDESTSIDKMLRRIDQDLSVLCSESDSDFE
ncbi:MAG: hypothetical protein DHS20C16_00810 [Phycisphaerae bacterium]|nr:MAG: hypothetical protein DHS20C16_00810 [Phycisphaerae bacterium]